ERSRGEPPVIDFDCAPPAQTPCPFEHRFAALDALTRLRVEADAQHQPVLSEHLGAHIAYLRVLLGEQLPFDEYIALTQGCSPLGWTRDYVEHRASIAEAALGSVGIPWNEHTWRDLHALSEQLPAADAGE